MGNACRGGGHIHQSFYQPEEHDSIDRGTDHQACNVLGHKTPSIRDLYTIGRKLGQGQIGTTYLCTEISTGIQYACKSICKRKLISKEDVRREIQIIHHLAGHENIVKIKSAYEDSLCAYCDGALLWRRIVRSYHPKRALHREEGGCIDKDYSRSEVRITSPRKYSSSITDQKQMYGLQELYYILLSGVPPFWAGDIDFESDPWPVISDSAKDLIRKMSCSRPSERLTAHEVVCHPWICENAPDKAPDPAVLSRLKKFSAMNKLKKMALRVIAESLSEEEIAAGLQRYGSTLKDTEIQEHMNAPDADNNGSIDYEEFMDATVHLNKLEREEHLLEAFKYFDKDNSCYITVNELQQACAEHYITDVLIDDIIREVDQYNDGIIDYVEFVAMMQKGNSGIGRRTMQNSLNMRMRDTIGTL
ncbi:Calcium-dependent protein kinase 5 [Hibiscus syriacus]|uniref:non-specific serine/threonine protein kinase n=1 Tax=Hibiscus syriacus TaxID=106335 RepID=A0A6A2X941_HIBSY|nr:Calcium-dependent protein kinase 5 [Hibiscus syriacus]